MQGGQMAAKDNVDGRHCSSELEREWELQGCNKCQVKDKLRVEEVHRVGCIPTSCLVS